MKLVIDIQDDTYNLIKSWNYPTDTAHKMLFELVTNGTPLDKIRAEIEKQEKWLLQAGYNAYNVDMAFDAIRAVTSLIEIDKDLKAIATKLEKISGRI